MQAQGFHFVATGVASWVAVVAIVVGAYGSYDLFFKNRESYAKANIQHSVEHIKISDTNNLIRIGIHLENSGNTLLRILSGEVRLERMLPLPDYLKQPDNSDSDPIIASPEDIPWPVIATWQRTWQPGEFQIEPGESDNLHYDLIIPSKYEVVNIYTYFTNEETRSTGNVLGWNLSTLYDFREERVD